MAMSGGASVGATAANHARLTHLRHRLMLVVAPVARGTMPPPLPAAHRSIAVGAVRGALVPVFDLSALMPASKPREFYIKGTTRAGRPFRPSDWSERLAGALSSFRPGGAAASRIGYSPYCYPTLIDGERCVVVNEGLRGIEPMAWDFAMNFARDNDLEVFEFCRLPEPGEGA